MTLAGPDAILMLGNIAEILMKASQLEHLGFATVSANAKVVMNRFPKALETLVYRPGLY